MNAIDVCILRAQIDFQKHTSSIIEQMYEIICCFCFKHLYWSIVDMCVNLSNSNRKYFLPFFQCFLWGGTPH